MIKLHNVLFVFDVDGLGVRALFEPLAARRWKVTLSADDDRPAKTITPRKQVSCWPCATHATTLVQNWLLDADLSGWVEEQRQRVHGEPVERPTLKVVRDE